MKGLFVAAGFNSSGIASAGGAGKSISEWIVNGVPTMDLWPVDIRRFGGFHANTAFLRERTKETLGLHYAMPWPRRCGGISEGLGGEIQGRRRHSQAGGYG
jgi:4-methylaminobutanoate oxidase (formaldehyde-forming)